MYDLYLKYKEDLDNKSIPDIIESLQKTKILSAYEKVIEGSKISHVKKDLNIKDYEFRNLGLQTGMTFVLNKDRKHPKRTVNPKTKSKKSKNITSGISVNLEDPKILLGNIPQVNYDDIQNS
jgi:hypothetical protein